MSQRASTDASSGHLMDAPITISNLSFFRSVQVGYDAYQQESAPLNEQDLYECFVHRLLAYPDSPCENVGWVIGWVKGLLETASPQLVFPTSSGRRFEVAASYAETSFSATLNDEKLYLPTTRPFCSDLSCLCHQDPETIEMIVAFIRDGLLTFGEADRMFLGKQLCYAGRSV